MKAYTYNDRLVGVGNDQILGTDQGGGSTYTAGNGIDITNDVISIDNTVALASGLPTTELGKFTIQSNVSGGPIEVLVPTDVAPVSAFYDLNAQYDDALSNRTGPSTYYYVFKSPGYDNDTWSANSGDVIQLKVNESIQGIGSIMGFYASNSSPASSMAPPINYPTSSPLVQGIGAAFTVEAGLYTTALGTNPAGSSYGKYITIMVVTGGTGIYVDDILNKIEFTIGRPNAALGTTVNLDRYYLGNTYTTTSNSGTQALIYIDPNTKKQTVLMPEYIPSNWQSNIIQAFQYGSSYNRPNSLNYSTTQYRAYKYTSSPQRCQFAYCTDWDQANNLMTFVAYDNDGNAIEKWTLNYSTYSSNVWTTTPIETGSTYTAGDHIGIVNDEISVTGVTDLVAGENITITVSGVSAIIAGQAGGSTYTAGTGIDIVNDVISIDNTVAMASAIPTVPSAGNMLSVSNNTLNVTTAAGITDIVSVTALPANPVATVIYLIPET